jgi:hypothetical protein
MTLSPVRAAMALDARNDHEGNDIPAQGTPVPAPLSRAADVDVLLRLPGGPVAKPIADGLQSVD